VSPVRYELSFYIQKTAFFTHSLCSSLTFASLLLRPDPLPVRLLCGRKGQRSDDEPYSLDRFPLMDNRASTFYLYLSRLVVYSSYKHTVLNAAKLYGVDVSGRLYSTEPRKHGTPQTLRALSTDVRVRSSSPFAGLSIATSPQFG
jgi:hypothetical protein